MSDQPTDLCLTSLRRIDAKVDDLCGDMGEVKNRLTTLEIQVSNLSSTEGSHYAHIMLRLDRHETRLDRIERRLDLVPG